MKGLQLVKVIGAKILMVSLVGMALTMGGNMEMSHAAPTPGQRVVRIAVGRALSEAPYFDLQRYADKYNFNVQVVDIIDFAGKMRALLRGSADVATIGFPNVAELAAQRAPDVAVISGGWWGQQWLVVRKGSGIVAWSHLAGKTVGSPPGSYAQIAFRVAAQSNGVLDRIRQLNTTFSASTEEEALRRGSYDAVVFFSPFVEQWVIDGVAEVPPFGLKDSPLGSASGLIVAGRKLLRQDRALGEDFVRAVVDMMRDIQKSPEIWQKIVEKVTGVRSDVAKLAVQRGCVGYNVQISTLKRMAEIAPDFGVTLVNASPYVVKDYVDLSFLRKVTGESEFRLTHAAPCAP